MVEPSKFDHRTFVNIFNEQFATLRKDTEVALDGVHHKGFTGSLRDWTLIILVVIVVLGGCTVYCVATSLALFFLGKWGWARHVSAKKARYQRRMEDLNCFTIQQHPVSTAPPSTQQLQQRAVT